MPAPNTAGVKGACTTYASPVGDLLIAALPEGLCGVFFQGEGGRGDLARRFPGVEWERAALPGVSRALDAYFRGESRRFDIPCALSGSPFELRVWEALRAIPYGETRTYGSIAAELGTSARAVGGACGRNPISIVVPCHRVVGRDGALTGYGGGLAAKRFLLELERRWL